MSKTALLALATLLLAGCAVPGSDDRGGPESPAIPSIPPLRVTVTPREAGEMPGVMDVASTAAGFAAESENSTEFPARFLRLGGEVFVSPAGMAWVRYDLFDERVSQVAIQSLAWDLRFLLSHPSVSTTRTPVDGGYRLEASGAFMETGVRIPYTLRADVRRDAVERAVVEATGAYESPYTLDPGPGVSFSAERPATFRAPDEAARLDSAAADRHAFLLSLVEEYARTRQGILPERIDPDTLAVELLRSGRSWPRNAYAEDRPMADGVESGAFSWTRCELRTGYYAGYGWDGAILDWGRRCA
ncbi:MAG TPA: hypothetical protein VM681_05265 [Candidatus Thermoplasmatota archaeon]|nr:hypothetical protein [Candidatus Thermoplasmatota archaeon]